MLILLQDGVVSAPHGALRGFRGRQAGHSTEEWAAPVPGGRHKPVAHP